MVSMTLQDYVSMGNLYLVMEKAIARPAVANAIERKIGRYAWSTLCAVRDPHRATATIMAVTACRWCELDDINLPRLFAGQSIAWRPSKGSAPRISRLYVHPKNPQTSRLSADTPPYVVQYPAHAAAIRQAARSVALEPSGHAHRATHVWRHLRAWHMLEQGCSIELISKTLGHRRPDSTAYYTRSMPAHIISAIAGKD